MRRITDRDGLRTKTTTGKSARAARLQQEAENCVSIAVQGRDPAHVGDLIDEAVKLARRSRELGGE